MRAIALQETPIDAHYVTDSTRDGTLFPDTTGISPLIGRRHPVSDVEAVDERFPRFTPVHRQEGPPLAADRSYTAELEAALRHELDAGAVQTAAARELRP